MHLNLLQEKLYGIFADLHRYRKFPVILIEKMRSQSSIVFFPLWLWSQLSVPKAFFSTFPIFLNLILKCWKYNVLLIFVNTIYIFVHNYYVAKNRKSFQKYPRLEGSWLSTVHQEPRRCTNDTSLVGVKWLSCLVRVYK